MENNNLKTQGYILLDVDVVALNNAGKTTSSNFDNAVETKSITKNGKKYVYVSGQAWRNWWRNSLQRDLNWELSPITRDSKIAYTNANPIKYADDDVFGYMRAAKEIVKDEKGKEKKVDVTVTRISPLKNSAIVSVAAVRPVENWSSMARQEGDSVPYGKEEYSAIMKGMFSLDLNMVGTFSNYNKTGFLNLSEKLKTEAIEAGAILVDDNYVPNQQLIRLEKNTRVKRAVDTIQVLKTISGGAMQTCNLGDVTPKFIILATTNTGNHPFSHVAKATGAYDENAILNIEGLEEVLTDYKDTFVGKVFIGLRNGFMDDEKESLRILKEKFGDLVELGSVNAIIDAYCEQMKNQME